MECLAAIAIMGILLLCVTPALGSLHHRWALTMATSRVRRQMSRAQNFAEALSRNCGVLYFQRNGQWMYAIYSDENGNGVLNADIKNGTDRRIEGPAPVLDFAAPIEIGFGDGETDPDTLAPFNPNDSPIEFNHSFLCSFSQAGSGTPGSVFLTDRGDFASMVRSSGADGNVRALFYNGKGKKWIER
jgi:hypothetical protein